MAQRGSLVGHLILAAALALWLRVDRGVLLRIARLQGGFLRHVSVPHVSNRRSLVYSSRRPTAFAWLQEI